jgi:hypothetical protein
MGELKKIKAEARAVGKARKKEDALVRTVPIPPLQAARLLVTKRVNIHVERAQAATTVPEARGELNKAKRSKIIGLP